LSRFIWMMFHRRFLVMNKPIIQRTDKRRQSD
jgi:hypothetical protein